MGELTPTPFVVPFNRPSTARRGLDFVADSLRSGRLAGDGPFSSLCETRLAELFGAPLVLLTTSCTDALEMAALLLDLRPGDEVIVPSFTFPSTALAFHLRGAVPVFCDIRNDTLNLDERALPALFTDRTRAVVAMHYAGVGCAMETITELCQSREIALVEDNAHGIFGLYNGKPLGSFGVFAAQSFHETKNLTCGEGGAIVVNDPSYEERAKILREKVRTGTSSAGERLRSTPGSTSARASCPPTSPLPCFGPSSRRRRRFKRVVGTSGSAMTSCCEAGRKPPGRGFPSSRARPTTRTTCTTSSSTRTRSRSGSAFTSSVEGSLRSPITSRCTRHHSGGASVEANVRTRSRSARRSCDCPSTAT